MIKKNNKGGIPRSARLNGEFQKNIYEVISRKLKNPLVTEMFSITSVDVSRDLSHAKVYISVYSTNKEKKEITLNAIKGDAKKIRYELAKIMEIRTVPELEFVVDDSMEYGDKIDKLLNKISQEEKN